MDTLIVTISSHGIYWYIGEAGILLEITGAWYIVQASFRARRHIQNIFRGWEGLKEIPQLKKVLQNQANTELIGFLLLGTGMVMQFIGGFSG